jgi:hypothetical protein
LASYDGETDPAIWALLAEISGVLGRIVDSDGLRAYIQALAGPSARRLSWMPEAGEPDTDGMVRGTVLELLGTWGGDADVIAEAQRRVRAAADGDAAALSGDVRRAALQAFGSAASEADFQTLLDGLRHAATPQDEAQYRYALAAVGHEALARRACDLCLTEIRSQDVALVLMYLMHGKQQAVVWSWMEEHWSEVQERLPSNLHARALQGITTVTDPELASRIRAFLEDGNMPAVGAKTVQQYLELMDVAVRFASRDKAKLAARFGA